MSKIYTKENNETYYNNMIKVGIILPALYKQQLAYEVFDTIHKVISAKVDPVVFFEDFSPIFIRPPCATMHISEILNFNGTLISTTLNNTMMSLKAINQAKKIFYIWDLEWIRNNNTINHKNNYLYNISIYQNPELELVTRSDSYAKELNNYANIQPKVSTMENLICQICGMQTS